MTDPKRILPNRKNVCIIHKKNLNEVDGFHYLGREHIAKVYRLSNPEQEAKATKKAVCSWRRRQRWERTDHTHLSISTSAFSDSFVVPSEDFLSYALAPNLTGSLCL